MMETAAIISAADSRPRSDQAAIALIIDLDGFVRPGAFGAADKRHEAVMIALIALKPPATGFFRVTGHGIEPRVLENARAAIYAFENAPATNHEAAKPPVGTVGFRGFSERETEKTGALYNASEERNDSCSCFSMGPSDDGQRFEPNIFPEQAGFQETLEELYAAFDILDASLYALFNATLHGEPSDEMLKITASGDRKGLLRTKHYAPRSDEREQMAGHADVTCFTILHTDEPGLEIATRVDDGSSGSPAFEWRRAPPLEPGELFVNTGEVIRAISNDRFSSCVHRVGRGDPTKARLSVAFFSAACVARGFEEPLLQPVIESTDEPVKFPPWRMEDFINYTISCMKGQA